MATTGVVVTGTLPTSGSASFTSSGFGTPTAAIIIAGNANTTNNPQDNANIAVGFWTSGGQGGVGIYSTDSAATSATYRRSDDAVAVQLGTDTAGLTYTVSSTTDGISISLTSGSPTLARHAAVILIKGTLNQHFGTINLGTGTSAIDITAPGFKPDIVFALCVGASLDQNTSNAIISFGAAHNNSSDVVSQAFVSHFDRTAQATMQSGQYTQNGAIAAQFYADSLSWQASLSAFDASGFSITPSANASSDYVYYLALELDDPDAAYVGLIDSRDDASGTGTTSYEGPGFQPTVIGLATNSLSSTGSPERYGAFSFGVSDGTASRTIGIHSNDEVADANANSMMASTAITGYFADGTQDFAATLSSFDSLGFNLNYSDTSVNARKVLAFAFGTAGIAYAETFAASGTAALALTDAWSLAYAETFAASGTAALALTDAWSLAYAETFAASGTAALALTDAWSLNYAETFAAGVVGDLALTHSYAVGNNYVETYAATSVAVMTLTDSYSVNYNETYAAQAGSTLTLVDVWALNYAETLAASAAADLALVHAYATPGPGAFAETYAATAATDLVLVHAFVNPNALPDGIAHLTARRVGGFIAIKT